MADGGMANPAIQAVLAALERLVADLLRRTEAAEARAAAAEQVAAEERRAREAETAARRDAEVRAANAERIAADAERNASEASKRADALEAASREAAERSNAELLGAAWKAVEAAQDAAAAVQRLRDDRGPRPRAEPTEDWAEEGKGPRAPTPLAGRTHGPSRRPMPHRRGAGAGYAWVEDDPAPSWWSRLFSRRRY